VQTKQDMPQATGTQAVDRAARLLTEVVSAPRPRSFSELAAVTGLAKSTASRLLFALERNGLVRRDGNGGYEAGEVFRCYAGRDGSEHDLVGLAEPFLKRLGEGTGETANLGVARRGHVEQLSQVDSRYLIGAANWVGRPVPLHATALGKVLLAYEGATLPPGRLARTTIRTITSRSTLNAELSDVRRCGYAVAIDELELGLVAIAAPVFAAGGRAIAAMSVSGPSNRLTPSRITEAAVLCRAEAGALSALLGHSPGRDRPPQDPPRQEGAA
jgi:DNA-binding IclR family transcriptional regulator